MKETLSVGDRGRAVRALNEGLRALGYEAGTGDRFTQSTARGLFALQQDRGLDPTGVGTAAPGACCPCWCATIPGKPFTATRTGTGS